jgi:methylphosphotriester-DNA--protein-cysteine methyltransferase
MLSPSLEESEWLAHYSPRHKRRLYRSTFGISKKEMKAIQNVHTFLGQTCDFSTPNPRIIEHIDSDVFYDQPHLNKAFKKMTGLSPLEYFQTSSILQDNLMAASYN